MLSEEEIKELAKEAEEKGNEYIPLKNQNIYARLQRKGYKDGYKDGFKYAIDVVLNKFKEAHLKEVESQFLSILDGISSWKPESKQGG